MSPFPSSPTTTSVSALVVQPSFRTFACNRASLQTPLAARLGSSIAPTAVSPRRLPSPQKTHRPAIPRIAMASPVLPIIRRTCPQLGRLAARPRASPTPSPLSSARPSPWRRCLHQTRARTEHHPSSPPPPPQQVVVNAAELQFGQPVHETHPHILESGESQSSPRGR
jgi:hypothetical protein